MADALPPTSSLQTPTVANPEAALHEALGAMAEAEKLGFQVEGTPGSDEYAAALRRADEARFQAAQKMNGAQFDQLKYSEETFRVAKVNEEILAADVNKNGKSDVAEVQAAEAAAPFKTLGSFMAAGVGIAAMTGPVPTEVGPAAVFGTVLLARDEPLFKAEPGPAALFNSRAYPPESFGLAPTITPTVTPTAALEVITPAAEAKPAPSEEVPAAAPVVRRAHNAAMHMDWIPRPKPPSWATNTGDN